MKLIAMVVGCATVLLLALSGWGANAPLQVVFVRYGTPTPFLLAEGNMDVTYALIESPANGALVGIPPHLTYFPRSGFAGTDWVRYLVQTETGQWDLGTVRLVVLSPGTTMTPFVLSSEGEMVWSGPTFSVDGYRLVLGVQARFTYFEQVVRATFTNVGFTSFVGVTRMTFEGDWPSPWLLPVTSTLDFDPTIPALKSWTVDARTTIGGTTWAYTFYHPSGFLFVVSTGVGEIVNELNVGGIADTLRQAFQSRGFTLTPGASVFTLGPNAWEVWSGPWIFRILETDGRLNVYLEGSYAVFQVQGAVGAFRFDSRTTFVTLTPTFGEQRLTLRGPWICEGCPTNWELEFLSTKAGFERLSFLIKDVEVPCSFCGSIGILFDTKITFEVDEKTVEPALRIGSGVVACVRPYVALPTPASPFGFSGIEVYGIEIRCDTEEGYTLRLATSFSPPRDSAVTGDLRFFELWQLEGPVVPCCGNPGRFQMTAYFKRGTGSLFGLGMGNIVVFIPLSRELLVNIGLKLGEVDPLGPTKTWILTLGWRGLW